MARILTPQFKFQIVLEALQGNQKHSEIARQYGVHPQLISTWKRQLLKNGSKVFETKRDKKNVPKKVDELENIIGRQTIEIQLLKKVLGRLG